MISCDETIDVEAKSYKDERKTIPTYFNEKNSKNVYILLALLLIPIALLIGVSICCYLIKYKSKQKHLLPYYVTNDKLTNVL